MQLDEFPSRLRLILGLQSATLTDEELALLADRYRECAGTERWEVRQYVGRTGVGAREYRVLRGTRALDVYRSVDRAQADLVGAALNALESKDSF